MALTIIIALAESLIENLPQIIEAGIAAILALVDGLTASLPELIPVAVEAIITIVNGLLDNLDKIIEAALELILALAEGLIAAIPKLLEAVPQIITKLIGAFTENFPKMIETGVKLLVSLVQNMPAIIAGILKALPQILAALVKGFAEMVPDLAECGLNLIKGLWDGITGAAGWLYEKISDFCSGIVESVKGFFKINSPSKVFAEIGGFLDMGLGEGIEDNAAEAFDAIDNLSRGIEDRFNPDLSGYSYGNQSMSYIAGSGRNASAGNSGIGGGNNITQNNYFTAPEMTAYEQQVQIKRLERDLVGGLK